MVENAFTSAKQTNSGENPIHLLVSALELEIQLYINSGKESKWSSTNACTLHAMV